MPYDQLNAVPKFAVARSEPLAGGLVSRWQPQYVRLDAYTDGLNVDLDDITRPSRRDGYSSCMGTVGLSTVTARASGILYYNPSNQSNRKIIMPVDDHAKTYYATAIGGNWSEVLASTTISIDPNGSDTPMFVVNDFAIMVRQTGEPVAIDSAGAAYIGPGNAWNPPDACVDGCAFLDRAYLLQRGAPNKAFYSSLLPTAAGFTASTTVNAQWSETSLGDTNGYFPVAPQSGGLAMAIRPWNSTSLLVFLNTCIDEIIPGSVYGSAHGSGATRRLLETRVGCCSRDSVVPSGQEMFFADQYGQIRSLGQTVNAAQAGVLPKPLSEPISDYLPGRVNKQYLGKIRSVVFKERLFVAFPLDSSTEANALAVYSLANKLWEGVWQFTHAIGRFMVSDLRGFGDELYFVDGSTTTGPAGGAEATKVMRLFDGEYEDDGEAIPFRYESPAMDFGVPELVKVPEMLEVEARADGGTTIQVSAQLDEDGIWQGVATQIVAAGSGFWISYPMTYPLVMPQQAALTRIRSSLKDLRNSGRCRFFRFRVAESTAGKQMAIAGWRVVTRPQPITGVTETI